MTGTGMHDQPRGLVDDQQVLVLENNVQVHGLGPKRQALGRGHQRQPDLLPDTQLARRSVLHQTVELHMATRQQLLQPTARELGRQRHQRLVQAQRVLQSRHDRFANFDVSLRVVGGQQVGG